MTFISKMTTQLATMRLAGKIGSLNTRLQKNEAGQATQGKTSKLKGNSVSLREQILDNIRAEIKKYLRDGVPLPARDPRWDLEIQRIMKEEKREFEEEQKAEIDMMYQTYYLRHVSGMTYEEWLDKAKKLYKVDASYTVYSIASGPEHEKQWICKDLKDAHKRILKLIGYKRRDHFERGHDFRYDPDENIS